MRLYRKKQLLWYRNIVLGISILGIVGFAPFKKPRCLEELKMFFPNAQIQWVGETPSLKQKCSFLSLTAGGEVWIQNGKKQEKLAFKALQKVWVPVQRVFPKKSLRKTDFILKTIDFSKGMYRSVRDLVVSDPIDFTKYQSRWTLLAGKPLLWSSVEKIPLLKRGAMVQVLIQKGTLRIESTAIAKKSGFIGDQIPVQLSSTKEVLYGKVRSAQRVEVTW